MKHILVYELRWHKTALNHPNPSFKRTKIVKTVLYHLNTSLCIMGNMEWVQLTFIITTKLLLIYGKAGKNKSCIRSRRRRGRLSPGCRDTRGSPRAPAPDTAA